MNYTVHAFFVLCLSNLSLSMQQPEGMQVKVFNVGQGSCAVVTYPGQPSLLVDAGSDQLPNKSADTIINNVVSYINLSSPYGISILISHPEKDHAGWIQKIISKLPTDCNL